MGKITWKFLKRRYNLRLYGSFFHRTNIPIYFVCLWNKNLQTKGMSDAKTLPQLACIALQMKWCQLTPKVKNIQLRFGKLILVNPWRIHVYVLWKKGLLTYSRFSFQLSSNVSVHLLDQISWISYNFTFTVYLSIWCLQKVPRTVLISIYYHSCTSSFSAFLASDSMTELWIYEHSNFIRYNQPVYSWPRLFGK